MAPTLGREGRVKNLDARAATHNTTPDKKSWNLISARERDTNSRISTLGSPLQPRSTNLVTLIFQVVFSASKGVVLLPESRVLSVIPPLLFPRRPGLTPAVQLAAVQPASI